MTQHKLRGGGALIGHGGGKGGGGGRVAKESPDSLHSTQYARILDLIGIGPTGGPFSGEENGLQDVFLNGTPIQNADGSWNFSGVEAHYRLGTQNQDPIPGFPAAENTIAVGVELKAATPWTQLITNPDLSAVRLTLSTDRLTTQNTKNGDLNGGSIEYAIDLAIDGGAFAEVLRTSMTGKSTQRYTRTHRIDLPPRATFWSLRVRRLTADSTSSAVANRTYVDAVTEVVDAKLRYPMMALMGYLIPAQLFSSIPTRAVRWKGREIRIPSNYDPVTRSYAGTWDGTFKVGVSSNPAWVLLDIWTNDIFGLGQRINLGMHDRYSLYRIAQYCDELVPDGLGGTEPRFRIVGQLRARADARKLLQDMASVFHGMSYEMGGVITTIADMPQDPVFTYSQANVSAGGFSYTGTRRATRYTVALVSYSNQDDFGRQKVETVSDEEGIARYGVRETQISTFLNISRGQAIRMGKWALLTSRMQTRGVKFSVGLEYAVAAPGRIVEIADNVLAGAAIGGRVLAATSQSEVLLDRVARVKAGDLLTINLPAGLCEERVVSAAQVEGERTRVRVSSPYSELPQEYAGWNVSAPDLKPNLFRISGLRRLDKLTAEITAIEALPGKHAAIDYDTKLDPLPTTIVPSLIMAAPTNVAISAHTSVEQGRAVHTLRIQWEGSKDASFYQVQWRRDNGNWVATPDTSEQSVDVDGIRAGVYQARVRAVSALDIQSSWVLSQQEQLDGDLAPPPAVSMLVTESLLYAIRVSWGYPVGTVSPIHHTELWTAVTPEQPTHKLADVPWPQSSYEAGGLPAGARRWFWARGVDSLGEAGPMYPAESGVVGTTSTDANAYLDAIRDLVLSTEQGQQLIAQLDYLQFNLGIVASQLGESDSILTDLSAKAIALAEAIAAEASVRAKENIKLANDLLAEQQERIQDIAEIGTSLQAEKAERIAADQQNRAELQTQIDTLSSEVADVLGAGPYEPARAYQSGELATYDGALYRAKQATTGNVPTNTTYWQKVGDYTSIGEAVADLSSQMVVVQSVSASNTQRITAAETTLGDQSSRIATVEQTSVDQAQRLTTVETTSGQNTSAISQLQTTDSQRAQQISQLQASDGQQNGRITTVETAQADLVSRTETLEQTSDTNSGRITAVEQVSAQSVMRLMEMQATQADNDGRMTEIVKVQSDSVKRLNELRVQSASQESRITVVEDVSASNTSRLQTLETTSGDSSAAIIQLQQTQEGQASQIETFQVKDGQHDSRLQQLDLVTAETSQRVTQLDTKTDGQGSRITAVEQTTASLASRTSQLETSNGESLGRLTVLEEATNQYSMRFMELQATAADADGQINDLVKVTATQAIRFRQMQVSQGDMLARIVQEEQARIDADGALAQQIQAVAVQTGENGAAITDEIQARVNGDEANAQAIQNVVASVGGNTAAIQQTNQALATLDGRVAANWGVKVQTMDNQRVVMGAISLGSDGETSTFAVAADRFVLFNNAGTTQQAKWVVPFAVQGGQVFLNELIAGRIVVNNAQIESLSGDKIEVQSLDANRIWTPSFVAELARIDTAYIKTANIEIAQIDTLRIKSGAVTVGAYGAGTDIRVGSSDADWVLIASASVNVSYEAFFVLVINAKMPKGDSSSGLPTDPTRYSLEIRIDGNLYETFYPNGVREELKTVVNSIPVGPGFHDLTIRGRRPVNGANYYTASAAILATLR